MGTDTPHMEDWCVFVCVEGEWAARFLIIFNEAATVQETPHGLLERQICDHGSYL